MLNKLSLIMFAKFVISLSSPLSYKCLKLNPLLDFSYRHYSTKLTNAIKQVDDYINNHKVLIFSKSKCPFCAKVCSGLMFNCIFI